MSDRESCVEHGHAVLVSLAHRFPQLYVAPGDDAGEAHRLARLRGVVPPNANLDHFHGSADDELRVVSTPAGPVEVVFLKERADFETFLQVVGHKSAPVPIARTVGAITYRGLADWSEIAAAHERYLASGGTDWPSAFARLAKEPGAFRTELVVISEGPYSNVPAGQTPYDEDAWLPISREIRLHHECAHVVCRRTMPDDILPVWDEVTADVVGLLCATGGYDADLAARFLGVVADGFVGGRLEEYLSDEQVGRIDRVAAEVYGALRQIAQTCGKDDASDPFGYLLRLKAEPLLRY